MGEHRHFPPEEPVQEHMFGRTRQPFLTTDDMGNLHKMVVDDVCKMVRWITVGFQQNLIVNLLSREFYIASDQISKFDLCTIRDFHPDNKRLSRRDTIMDLFLRQAKASAVVLGGLLLAIFRIWSRRSGMQKHRYAIFLSTRISTCFL